MTRRPGLFDDPAERDWFVRHLPHIALAALLGFVALSWTLIQLAEMQP